MKLLVCCLIIIANISNNGKASLDSFVPSKTNILLEDTTKNTDKSCYRPCKFSVKPRRCHYNFKIEPTIQEDGRPVLTINGLTPGPPIHVCVNDIVVVEVQNKIPDQDLAIHWHGIEQKGTPYMDGVPMVTQCPIGYGSTYKYAFRASSPGTFFYHSDSVSHQSDGVFGALIVNQPQPLEPHSSLYDYDRIKENTLILSARFPQLLTANLDDLTTQMKPISLLINGDESSWRVFVMSGFAYRLRLINAIAIECPLVVNIEKHEMVIISTDGKPVKPVAARKVLLYAGERMDVVVRASLDGGGYWIHVRGASGACAGLVVDGMFLYSGFNYTSMLQLGEMVTNIKPDSDRSSAINGQTLESLQDALYSSNVKSIYLGIDKNIVKFKDSDNDFRYISDAIPKKPFFPALLSLRETGVVQINRKSFLYPNAPLLLRPRDIRLDNVCAVGAEDKHREPQCVQILNAQEGEVLELILVNEGFGSNDSYTFHMHGHSMQIVGMWQNPDMKPVSKEVVQRFDKEGKIIRNKQNPPMKDTIVVPNKGLTIIRIKPDHGGTWLFECRSCSLYSLPTAMIINVPQTVPKTVLDSLPKCGNYRPPDVLLN